MRPLWPTRHTSIWSAKLTSSAKSSTISGRTRRCLGPGPPWPTLATATPHLQLSRPRYLANYLMRGTGTHRHGPSKPPPNPGRFIDYVPMEDVESPDHEFIDSETTDETGERIRPLPWASRLSSMPYLPGGGAQQVDSLRALLSTVIGSEGLLTLSIADGSGAERSLRDAVKPLSSAGFIQPLDRAHVSVTDEAQSWLATGDDAQLLAIFHRHIRFIGELLQALEDGPRSVRDLMSVASERYDLVWSTPDQTRRRITWLSCLGAVEYRTATLVALTDTGRPLLSALVLDSPTLVAAPQVTRVEVKDPPPAIAVLITDLTPQRLAARNSVLGYIPRGNGGADAAEALLALVNASSPSTTKADLLAFAERNFGVGEASFAAALTMLTKSGLIEQTSLGVFETTPPAREWLETADPLDLVLLIHAHYLFVLEIIPMLAEHDRAPDLARAAVDYFGMQRVDTSGVRTRLQLLKSAGLIIERANWRYQASPLGEEIAARTPIQQAIEIDSIEQTAVSDETQGAPGLQVKALQLAADLVKAGTDSEKSIRLEQLTAQAFQFLGFEARHIGGGGKTDVLATAEDRNLNPVRFIVDAKSARSGTVSEGAVSFDTLREHKEQHRADHVILVGPNFDSGRVRGRAEQNKVALITTAELAAVVRRHVEFPLSAHYYLGLITGSDNDRRDLESHRLSVEQRIGLLAQVVSVLAEESRDPDDVTHGALTSNEVYLIARSAGTGPRPKTKDIEAALDLLQHPLLASVRAMPGDRARASSFYLVDRPSLVQDKLAALVRALDGLEDEE